MRHIGKFKVSRHLIETAINGDGANLFKDMVVIGVRHDFFDDCVEYIAYHPDFESIPYGLLIPEYRAAFDSTSPYPKWSKT